jgi:hypothetical protein
MTAIFQLTLETETLTCEELQAITGCARKGDQIAWLETEGWNFFRNRGGDPVVGRLYARLKLAGLSPTGEVGSGQMPNFSALG